MKIDNYVRDNILARIKNDLKAHLLSDKSYPTSVTIVTEYEECTQKLTIDFTDLIPENQKEGENNDSM